MAVICRLGETIVAREHGERGGVEEARYHRVGRQEDGEAREARTVAIAHRRGRGRAYGIARKEIQAETTGLDEVVGRLVGLAEHELGVRGVAKHEPYRGRPAARRALAVDVAGPRVTGEKVERKAL